MNWNVVFHQEFEKEFLELPEIVQDEFYAQAMLLEEKGPVLGRPTVDSLQRVEFSKSERIRLKELRFTVARGVWRAAFAFDKAQDAVMLTIRDKSAVPANDKRRTRKWYAAFNKTASERIASHVGAST